MFRKRKPSRILRDYINGLGRGDEIDDYIHDRLSEMEEKKVVEPLLIISGEFSTSEFPIGISNPASFKSIEALANALEAEGM